MIPEPHRPDPDALLESLQQQEARAKRGRLKVFFGMCPGVGKTFSMLRAGQEERVAGTRVIVGIVETHGRSETLAVLEGLEVLPRRNFAHRDTTLDEMDLEALLARRPALALVDELAHTNAPGSRHAKRWQDVVELLDAGIDVFTTLNVQHVESRADAVRQITGIPVRETVPDSLLDLADEFELVDLTSEALRERLSEGKVYLGERATLAADNFFREENLGALRELALRYTAERVDRQLHQLRTGMAGGAGGAKRTVWRSSERLLVAVGASPFSTQLVRWTRRLAAAQGAPWLAVHVEGTHPLARDEQLKLDANLALARELGAEVFVTRGDDVATVLVRIALQHNATQIVIGKPRGLRWLEWARGGSLVDRLVRRGGNIDIYVVPAEEEGGAEKGARARRGHFQTPAALRSPWREYGLTLGVVAAITLAGALLPGRYYLATGLVYLLAVIALSLRVGRGPVLLAGVASALVWNLLFIPPRFTLAIGKVEDVTLFITYFAVALIAGQLTARIRAQSLNERSREERASALFTFSRALAEARSLDEAVFAGLHQIDTFFGATSMLLISRDSGALLAHAAGSHAVDEKEHGVADWVFRNRKPAGRFTDTLPGSAGYWLPLVREERALGVLGVVVPERESLTLSQRDLLDAFGRQLALIVERDRLRAASEREKLLGESDKLHRVLLDSVSHELRTPLAVITGALETLEENFSGDKDALPLLAESRVAAKRLNRLVGNLLDQTRLESGALRARMDWCDARDIVNAATAGVRDALAGRPLEIAVPDDMPPLRADFTLIEQALANLLLNAARHTPENSPVFLAVGIETGDPEESGAGGEESGGLKRVFFTVADRGRGFPPEMRERLFKKFARGDAARAGGLGLGLSIVRGFVVAQGGEVKVGENPGGGAVFTIYLPYQKPLESAAEESTAK